MCLATLRNSDCGKETIVLSNLPLSSETPSFMLNPPLAHISSDPGQNAEIPNHHITNI